MARSFGLCAWMVLGLGAGACGGTRDPESPIAARVRTQKVERSERVLAADLFARADGFRDRGQKSAEKGDSTSADLEYERAIAAFETARSEARIATIQSRGNQAQEGLTAAQHAQVDYAQKRSALEAEVGLLEAKLKIARESALPEAVTAIHDPERERARSLVTKTTLDEAALFCYAAAILGEQDAAIATQTDMASARKLEGPAALEHALALRGTCLSLLTRARRGATGEAVHADRVLAEMSATRAFDVSRDERGVVVILADPFQKDGTLKPEAKARLAELGRSAAGYTGIHAALALRGTLPSNIEQALRALTAAVNSGGLALASAPLALASSGVPRAEFVFVARE